MNDTTQSEPLRSGRLFGPYASFIGALCGEPIICRVLRHQNGSFEDCILQLANECQRLRRRVSDLEDIAPKKILMPDGTAMVHHCPDDLIPLSPNTKISHAPLTHEKRN